MKTKASNICQSSIYIYESYIFVKKRLQVRTLLFSRFKASILFLGSNFLSQSQILKTHQKLFGMHNINILPNTMKIDISVAYSEFWSPMNWSSKVWWNSLQLKCSLKKFKSSSPKECVKFQQTCTFLLAFAFFEIVQGGLKWKRNMQQEKLKEFT